MYTMNEQIFNEGKRVEAAYLLARLLCKLEIAKMRRENDPNGASMLQMSNMPKNFRNTYMLPIASIGTNREYAVLVPIDEEQDKMDINLDV